MTAARSLRAALPAALLFVVAFAGCLPALDGPFVFDEHVGIAENRVLRTGSPLRAALFYRYSPDQMRPVFFASLWADAQLFGTEPRAFRLTGFLLHLAAGGVVLFLFARAVALPAALAGTALFLLHPLQSESVFYIWGRSEVLAALFMLAAVAVAPVRAAAHGTRAGAAGTTARWVAALACAGVALLSKEEAVVLPLVAWIWWSCAERLPPRPALRAASILSAPVALFLILRPIVLGDFGRQVFARGVADNILAQAVVTLRMLRLVLWPSGQSLDHAAAVPGAASGAAALAACAAIVAAAVALVRRDRAAQPAPVDRPQADGRAVRHGAVGGGILIAAASCLIYWLVPLPDLMSERRLYLPMVGVALAVAGLAAAWPRRSGVWRFLPAALIVAAFAPMQVHRARMWSEPDRLWHEAARRAPGKARPLLNLGVLAAGRGDRAAARRYLDGALVLDPGDVEALFNRGKLRLDADDLDGAETDLETAVAVSPRLARARINLAIVKMRRGDMRVAERELRAALLADPDEPRALANLAEILRATGREAEAVPLYRRALAADPSYAFPAARLGVALEQGGDPAGALAAYREYLARGAPTPADRDAVQKKIRSLEALPPVPAP